VDLKDVKQGDEMFFDDVLLYADGDDVRIGTPVVQGVRVRALVEANEKARKVTTIKFRRRKDFQKTKGHRQKMTRVKITEILLGSNGG
jgi:large subunit ribosomal protein L21